MHPTDGPLKAVYFHDFVSYFICLSDMLYTMFVCLIAFKGFDDESWLKPTKSFENSKPNT